MLLVEGLVKMDDLKTVMENMVKAEAERSIGDKRGRLKNLYNNVKDDVRRSYEKVVEKFRSMVV